MLSGVLHENRRRAEAFGDDAEQYDRSRPPYPDAMLDEITSGARPGVPLEVLDVGCGTGIAARQLLSRGCRVVGVEPDARMAAVARRHGVEVEEGRFEAWGPGGREFDLLTAGQSWHWVDPFAGAAKAADVLKPGGRVALFWNMGQPPADVEAAFYDLYARRASETDQDSLMLGRQDPDRFRAVVDGLRACSGFSEPVDRVFVHERYYRTDDWIDQIQTHSDHRVLPPDQLDGLLGELRSVLDGLGGGFTMTYKTRLIAAERTGKGA